MAFAQAAQVSRRLPWHLRKLRKSLGVCRGICASRASLSAFAVTFAQAALGLAAFAGDALTGCAGLILCAGFLIGDAVCIISFILICRIRIFIRVPSGAFLSDCEGKGKGAIKARQYVILRTYVC